MKKKLEKLFFIYGSGGSGTEILSMLNERNSSGKNIKLFNNNQLVVVDDLNNEKNKKVISIKKLLNIKNKIKEGTIGIQDPNIKKKIYEKIKKKVNFFNFKHSTSLIYNNVKIGIGHVLWPYVIIFQNVKIGNFFHASTFANIGHDSKIGNYVSFGPGVRCGGNVEIGDNVFIGTNAIIYPGSKKKKLKIGKNSIIGAGAFIIDDVPPNSTFAGNPARMIFKK